MSRTRTIDVFARPDRTEPSGYKFWMKENGVQCGTIVFNKTKDKMRMWDNYKVQFRLNNEGGARLVFSKDLDTVMWAMATDKPTNVCPPNNSKFDQFYVDDNVPIEDNMLTVINLDKSWQPFVFALNFIQQGDVDGDNTNYICYDPIGSNQDSGSGYSMTIATASFVAGAAIGALAASTGLPLVSHSVVASAALGGLILVAIYLLVSRMGIGRAA